MTRFHQIWLAVIALLVAGTSGLYLLRALTPAPWVWEEAHLEPAKFTRADVQHGVDFHLCKTGHFVYLPNTATTYQQIVPIEMREGKAYRIGGAVKPLPSHTVDRALMALPVQHCRARPDRLDTTLGVGWWGLDLDTVSGTWRVPFTGVDLVHHSMPILIPFEVTP